MPSSQLKLFALTMLLLTAPFANAQRLAPAMAVTEEPGAGIDEMTHFKGKVYFSADDGVHGQEPWQSDGTAEATRMLGDIVPGQTGSRPHAFTEFKDLLYFVAETKSEDGHISQQLWSVSKNGDFKFFHQRYRDEEIKLLVLPGQSIYVWGERLVFKGETRLTGAQIWATDGESESPTLIWCDAEGGALPVRGEARWSLMTPEVLYVILWNGEVWGASRNKAGMSKVFDHHGENETAPIGLIGDNLVYSFFDVGLGREPYIANTTAASGRLLKDILPGVGNGCVDFNLPAISLGERLLFAADDGIHGCELLMTDGTQQGTELLFDINPGLASSKPDWFQRLGTKVLFSATDLEHGNELWVTDTTTQGTHLLADIAPGPESSNVHNFVLAGDHLYFDATTPATGEEEFVTDGTTQGTHLFADVLPGKRGSQPSQNEITDKYLVFAVDDGIHGRELWRADLKTGVAAMVRDIRGPAQSPMQAIRSMTAVGNEVYFVAATPEFGTELWCLAPGDEAPRLVQDIYPGPASSNPEELTALGNKLIFIADTPESAPTVLVVSSPEERVTPLFGFDTGLTHPHNLVAWNDILFLVATQTDSGEELWCLRRPNSKPELVRDICPDKCDARPDNLCITPSGIVFTATGKDGALSFWFTDGTKDGTHPIGGLPNSGR